MRYTSFIAIIFFSLILGTVSVYAHDGNTIIGTTTVGEYSVEFEYSDTKPILAGVPYQYVVYLLNKKTGDTVPVDAMFVRITDSTETLVLAGKLATSVGISGTGRILGMMPTEGTYTATVDFVKGDTKIATASFPLSVVKNNRMPSASRNTSYTWLLALVGGVVLGMGIGKKMSVRR